MKVLELLLHHTNVGDLIIFKDSGWQIGCTIIDHEDLFTRSLSTSLLTADVESYGYEIRDWTVKPVLVVNIF